MTQAALDKFNKLEDLRIHASLLRDLATKYLAESGFDKLTAVESWRAEEILGPRRFAQMRIASILFDAAARIDALRAPTEAA